ncbi:MAG: hypothetical protein ACD_75C01101G0001 [uncultured bacterium]|nr:MAG: hypothetical protein ACD_75C01101G0001 [uncultured bacterium]
MSLRILFKANDGPGAAETGNNQRIRGNTGKKHQDIFTFSDQRGYAPSLMAAAHRVINGFRIDPQPDAKLRDLRLFSLFAGQDGQGNGPEFATVIAGSLGNHLDPGVAGQQGLRDKLFLFLNFFRHDDDGDISNYVIAADQRLQFFFGQRPPQGLFQSHRHIAIFAIRPFEHPKKSARESYLSLTQ